MAVVLNQSDLGSRRRRRGSGAATSSGCSPPTARPARPCSRCRPATGEGLDALRRLLRERVAARDAAVARLGADVRAAAAVLGPPAPATARAGGIRRDDRKRLLAALEEAAGVPTVVRAVADAHRRRGALATGWPFVRWTKRLRPDPLRRLRLPDRPQPAMRTSLPPPTDVQRAQVDTAARRLADGAAEGLPEPWPRLVREAATAADDRVADRLDRAVASSDLARQAAALVDGRAAPPARARGRCRDRGRVAARPRGARLPARRRRRPAARRCAGSRSRRGSSSAARSPARSSGSPRARRTGSGRGAARTPPREPFAPRSTRSAKSSSWRRSRASSTRAPASAPRSSERPRRRVRRDAAPGRPRAA